jgi:nitroreductase
MIERFGVTLSVGIGDEHATEVSGGFDLGTVDRLLSTTRAVRKRLDLSRPVPRDVILDCIRLSQQAPTGSNRQGWRWVVVTEARKRARLAEIYRAGGAEYLSAALAAVPPGDAQTRRVYESALWLVEHLAEVPVHVIPCALGRLPDGVPGGMKAGFYGSIFPAVWSFQLALRSRGLGSVLTTLHVNRESEAAELLGIPADVTQVGLLPVAYTTKADFRPASRPPPESIVHFDRW